MNKSTNDRLPMLIRQLRNDCVFELLEEGEDQGLQFSASEANIRYMAVVRTIFEAEHTIILMDPPRLELSSILVTVDDENVDITKDTIKLRPYKDTTMKVLRQAVFSKYCKGDDDPDLIPSDVLQLRIK